MHTTKKYRKRDHRIYDAKKPELFGGIFFSMAILNTVRYFTLLCVADWIETKLKKKTQFKWNEKQIQTIKKLQIFINIKFTFFCISFHFRVHNNRTLHVCISGACYAYVTMLSFMFINLLLLMTLKSSSFHSATWHMRTAWVCMWVYCV